MMLPDAEDEREALKQSIERDEAELREAVDELTHAVRRELTIGRHIAEHPMPWLLGAFVFGIWLGRPNERD
jgi:hypothetical protein